MDDRQVRRAGASEATPIARRIPAPLLILGVSVAACLLLLALPLTLPLGPMYWDLVVYLDGAQRVLDGQLPSVDFFAPVGPLGYWLAALGLWTFPQAQLLLLVQWSPMLVTVPLMALVAFDVDRRSRPIALALVLPFLLFQLMPVNVEQFSNFPSLDGYGIYNRHVSNVLYVLTAALLFARSGPILLAVVTGTCLALFLLKITGFLTGGLLCFYALLAGRVSLRLAIAAAAIFLAVLGAAELSTGLVGAYVGDIARLVVMNEGALLPRFVQAASIHFGIIGSAAFLCLALLVASRGEILGDLRGFTARPSLAALARFLDRPLLWLGVGLAGGIFFEAQNTGGQAFIFLWPILLGVLLQADRLGSRMTVLVFALTAATALPPAVNTVHRLARALIGQVNYVALEHEHLGPLGAVSQRPEAMERATGAMAVYAEFPETYEALAARRLLPNWSLYSDLDFQLGWLMSVDEAAGAVLAYEAVNGVRFETILNLNFVNPFPAILGRSGTRHVAIGADPFRAVPPPDAETLGAVAATDLVLYPTCPITVANELLRSLYQPALGGHEEISLSPCWIGYVRRG